MMPTNIPDETGTSPEATLEPAAAAAPLPAAPPPAAEPVKSKASILPLILAAAGLLLALGVGGYACSLHGVMAKLQQQLKQDEFTIQGLSSSLKTAQATANSAQTNACALQEQIGTLDTRAENKFKGYDDYLTKNLPAELKKITALENRMTEDSKALSSQEQADFAKVQDLQQTLQTNGNRLDTAILVLKTQNEILRKILPPDEAKKTK